MSEAAAIPVEAREGLSPRERLLERAAGVLRLGAIANGALAAGILLVALLAALLRAPGLTDALRTALVFRYSSAGDTALAVAVLLALFNLSLLLVLMVGALARELWTLPGLALLAIGNVVALVLLGFTPAVLTIGAAIGAALVARRDLRAFRLNPVMLKELRGRMRGTRAFVVMTVYLGLMSGLATLLYLIYSTANRASGSAAGGEIGRVLFMGIVGIELLLIIFIAPAFTAGAITGEKERQTYDLLKTTLLATPSFVIGKLESALGYIILLLLAAIPLQSVAFLFGGVSETELILSFVILAVTAVALGSVGIYFSAVMQRTLTASVRAYTVTLVATFAVPLILSVLLQAIAAALYGPGASASNSPVVEAAIKYLQLALTSMNPVSAALTTQQLIVSRNVAGFWTDTLTSGTTIPMVAPWVTFTIAYLTASAVLIVLTIRTTRHAEL